MGLPVVTVLKIDVDWVPREGAEPYKWSKAVDWAETRKKLYKHGLKALGYRVLDIKWAWTDRGIHFYVLLDQDLEPEELLKLQWVLGDDPVRCEINYYRLRRGHFPKYNILFDKVTWRRPPDERCIKCSLYRWFTEEIRGAKPPVYATVFTLTEDEVTETILKMDDIARKDPTFTYNVETIREGKEYKLIIYSMDKDQAIKRGLWVKDKIFQKKKNFQVYSLEEVRLRPS